MFLKSEEEKTMMLLKSVKKKIKNRMLLKSGADSNLEMEDGRTPIHIAAEVILRKYWL